MNTKSKPEGYKSKKEFKAICDNCKHDHVVETGDNGPYGDELMFEVLGSCCDCHCEHYKPLKKPKFNARERELLRIAVLNYTTKEGLKSDAITELTELYNKLWSVEE